MINNIIKDIEGLRGSEVKIFGQPTVLPSMVDDFTIDILDVLETLKEHEVYYEVEVYNEAYEGFDFKECETVEEYIQCMFDNEYIEETDIEGNSYNWSSPISNHFDYKVYRNSFDRTIYIEFKVHRFGDVRCNYTDSCILKFDEVIDFYNILMEFNKSTYMEINGTEYEVIIDILSDTKEVFEDGLYICSTYGENFEDIKKDIVEYITEDN